MGLTYITGPKCGKFTSQAQILHNNSVLQSFGNDFDIRKMYYRQTSNINHTLVGNIIVAHSDVVGASPVGAAPTSSSFLT